MRQALVGVAGVLLLSTGCAASFGAPVTGLIYNGSKGTVGATSNELGSRTGRSCACTLLGLIGRGDASVSSAAREGGITKISTVDSDNLAILGIYARNCTVVTGE